MKCTIGADKHIVRKACSECRAPVPERQEYPFRGHRRDCSLVATWRRGHRAMVQSHKHQDAVNVEALVRKLKRRAAYWRREQREAATAPAASLIERMGEEERCAAHAWGVEEAIAIIEKAVAGRGVRGKRKSV